VRLASQKKQGTPPRKSRQKDVEKGHLGGRPIRRKREGAWAKGGGEGVRRPKLNLTDNGYGQRRPEGTLQRGITGNMQPLENVQGRKQEGTNADKRTMTKKTPGRWERTFRHMYRPDARKIRPRPPKNAVEPQSKKKKKENAERPKENQKREGLESPRPKRQRRCTQGK